jgi:putative long chain acyl-CoA synthase
VLGENNNPVRLFAGSGLRKDVWRRLVDRFGPVGVLEMYASSEASIVLANARGKKLGSVGRPLPGSPELAVAAWSFTDDDFVRDAAGHLVHARLDEPGLLVAKITSLAGPADIASVGQRRVVSGAFAPGDRWLVTGDVFQVDAEGDYWFIDRHDQMIVTTAGPVASLRIEDAIYELPGIALCAVAGRPDPDDPARKAPFAAIALHPGKALDAALTDALSRAVATLPDHARPRWIRLVESLPVTDGFRPIKRAIAELDLGDRPDVLAWDALAQRYRPTTNPAARSA